MISTLFGAIVLLFFVLLAVQITLALHTRTVVAAIASDAARDVAAARQESRNDSTEAAVNQARERLGDIAQDSDIVVREVNLTSGPSIEVRVAVDVPTALPGLFGGRIWSGQVTRTATARIEAEPAGRP
jgi:Flp pilus assembly protein TadG